MGESEGLVFTNYQFKDFPTGERYFDEMTIGQDFGFNHANAILAMGSRDDDIYVCFRGGL